MKFQHLFSLKKNKTKLSSAAVVIGALRVKNYLSGVGDERVTPDKRRYAHIFFL